MNHTETVSLPAIAIARITAAVASLNGPRFTSFLYRAKESGELARHVLSLGADYGNLVTRSVEKLTVMGGDTLASDVQVTKALQKSVAECAVGSPERKRANAALRAMQDGIGAERAACAELFISLLQTLASGAEGQQNPAYTKAGIYETVCPGITCSRTDGTFEVHGLSIAKTIIEPGTFPVVNSSAKTIAKEKLRSELPIGKYRTFALDMGAVETIRIAGSEIDVQEIS